MEPQRRGYEVVYLAGYGRSGSTLLDSVLGNHDDVFGAGELTWLFRDYDNHGLCSCGVPLPECNFWRSVVDRVFRTGPTRDGSDAASLTYRAEHLTNRGRFDADYIRLWQATFLAISEVSGKCFIVDSSKSNRIGYYRLPLLATHLGVRTRVLHLVRDPRAVMWSSFRGTNRHLAAGRKRRAWGGMTRGLVSWMFSNFAVEALRRRNPQLPVTRLRYEDLIGDPTSNLEQVAIFLGVDLTDISTRAGQGESFASGHGIAGNRMRRSREITFRFDNEWETELPRTARFASRIAWPLMSRYRYT